MPIPGSKSDTASPGRRPAWRPVIRSLHRDLGYLSVGFTLIYAVSGLAVNHILDWDPNTVEYRRARPFAGTLSADRDEAVRQVTAALAIREPVREAYRYPDGRLYLRFDRATLHVDPARGRVVEEGQRDRFFLRLANWLHLNRGKKAWTYVADAYALGLLCLAISGLFMLPGRKGLIGRGGILVLAGIMIPLLYVTLSGGPSAQRDRPAPPAGAASLPPPEPGGPS